MKNINTEEVICIIPGIGLTKGKLYRFKNIVTMSDKFKYILIEDDNNNPRIFSTDRFIRNTKLNKVLYL